MGLKGNRAELEIRVEALRAEVEAAQATKADQMEGVAEAQRQVGHTLTLKAAVMSIANVSGPLRQLLVKCMTGF